MFHPWPNHTPERIGFPLANRTRTGPTQHPEFEIGFLTVCKRKRELIADDHGVIKRQRHTGKLHLSELAVHSIGSFAENCRANSHMSRPFLDGHLKITTHPHAEVGQARTMRLLQMIAQLTQVGKPAS